MTPLAAYMQILADRTGWAGAKAPDSFGVWHCALENGLDALFYELGQGVALVRGEAAQFTDQNSFEKLCQKAARLQIMVVRDHDSVLALEAPGTSLIPAITAATPTLVCYQKIALTLTAEEFLHAVENWLNEFFWWKKNLEEQEIITGSPLSDLFSSCSFPLKL